MEYELIRSDRRSISAIVKCGKLIVRAPRRMSQSEIELFLSKHKRWIEKHLAESAVRENDAAGYRKLTPAELKDLTERAKVVIAARVAYYAPLVDVTYGRITIRTQRTRWGSCSSKGNLNFNALLMLAPPSSLDAIVVHELCHRKEMNHSRRFYAEVLRVFPEYHKHRNWLKENGRALLSLAEPPDSPTEL